jgi:phospholipase D
MREMKISKKSFRNPFFIFIVFIAGIGCGALLYSEGANENSVSSPSKIKVCFSPEGQCENVAVKAIESAKEEILVQCYSFTAKRIADALLKAHFKGIRVKVLFDKSQIKAPYSQIHKLSKAGIQTTVDYVSGIAHNKIIIIDSSHVLTGSYNFSKSANSRNAENMLLIRNKNLSKIYRKKWYQRLQNRKKKKKA